MALQTAVKPRRIGAQRRAYEAIAAALVADLGQTHRAIKTAMRWTGASERTVKYWMSAERGKRHADPLLPFLI